MNTALDVRLISMRGAKSACDRWHSHHEPPIGGLFAIGVFVGDRIVCAAVVSRPVARRLQEIGGVAEVTRLASDGTTRGAASAALRACVREAATRGYARVVSYTLLGESGACYRAARWRPTHITGGGEWSCRSRKRKPALQPGKKVRWEGGVRRAPALHESVGRARHERGQDRPASARAEATRVVRQHASNRTR